MRGTVLGFLMLAGCASGPMGALRGPPGAEVEVVGRITHECTASGAPVTEAVTLRAAGELDALGTTETDASGAFHFRVLPPEDSRSTLFVEARGRRAFARQQEEPRAVRVAELVLPCAP